MKNSVRIATLASIIANAIFGFSFMFSRLALDITAPFVMLAYRFTITTVILIIIAMFNRNRCPAENSSENIYWLRFDLRGRRILPLLVLGLFQPIGYFLCESYGISLTNATVSGVIIALVPIVGIVAAAGLLSEFPTRKQIIFSILSIFAVAWLTILQNEGGKVHPLGILLLLGAVLTGVLFNVISRKLAHDYSVLERTTVMMSIAAFFFIVLSILQCSGDPSQLFEPLSNPQFLLSIAYLSICSSVIAFMSLNYANSILSVAKTTAFANLTTVISLFAGAIFLGDTFNLYTLIASALIIFFIRMVQID